MNAIKLSYNTFFFSKFLVDLLAQNKNLYTLSNNLDIVLNICSMHFLTENLSQLS